MKPTLRIATFNIHKGVSSFNTRLVLHKQRELVRKLHADIVFLQEVRGEHRRHSKLTLNSQYEYLADSIWHNYAYGKNAVISEGHHGNAVLSKYPIVTWENVDVSASHVEQRGLLHCEIEISGWQQNLHCICVHFGLFSAWRRKQLKALNDRINQLVPSDAPLIIAGDFNDWRQEAGSILSEHQHLQEVFKITHGSHARSFPSLLPMFKLDRIYARGFNIQHCQVHSGSQVANLSDHAALSADLIPI
ncbi:MAG TPA: endonuclease/exonuclease/phosphatase family protein [Methylophilaceae bacterium]|nr:endonuclease/exonuclease/phosphatase family protein [Methylophilaceae bacterium]